MCWKGWTAAGKGTQAKLLAEALVCRGVPLRPVTFPDYSSPSSSLVKMYLNGEFGAEPEDVNAYAASAFYAVDRFASFRKGWGGDYRQGKLILCDRYATSNMVYQMGKLPRAEWDGYLAWVEDFEYQKLGIPRPDPGALSGHAHRSFSKAAAAALPGGQREKGYPREPPGVSALLRGMRPLCREASGLEGGPLREGRGAPAVEEIHRAVLAAVEPLLEKP